MDNIEFKQIKFTVFDTSSHEKSKTHDLIGYQADGLGVFVSGFGDVKASQANSLVAACDYTGETATFPTRDVVVSIENAIAKHGVQCIPCNCLALLYEYERDNCNGERLGVTRAEAKVVAKKLTLAQVDSKDGGVVLAI